MSAFAASLLAVLLIADPEEAERIDVAQEIVELGDEDAVRALASTEREEVRISSVRADFDREEGVVLFEGDAVLEYSDDYRMEADRLFAFFAGSNALDRVVALGRVSVSNETRVGVCSSAVFRRAAGEIELCGTASAPARLAERGADEISGRRIRFWIDGEQVEVEGSTLTFEKGNGSVKKKGKGRVKKP